MNATFFCLFKNVFLQNWELFVYYYLPQVSLICCAFLCEEMEMSSKEFHLIFYTLRILKKPKILFLFLSLR